MGSRRFYLYPRKNGVIYAELLGPEGTRVLYRSTGTKNRDEAAAIVGRWLAEGIPLKGKLKPIKEAAAFQSVKKYLQTGDFDEKQAREMALALKKRGLLDIGINLTSKINR